MNTFSPKFEETYTVGSHETDANGICRAADTVRYLQETAVRQLDTHGPDAATLAARGQAFILSRISYEFPEPLYQYDRVTAASWPCPTKHGFVFDRNYTMTVTRGDTVLCAAKAVSQWAVWDMETRRLIRTEDFGEFYVHDEAVGTVLPLRFRIPHDLPLEKVGEKTIRYSDIDKNGHFNNTRYIDLFCDYLPCLTEGKRVSALAVAYLQEAPLGETLSVFSASGEADTWYFRTVRQSDGAVNAEAVIRTVGISR